MTFRCGHPREGNTAHGSCALCRRVRASLYQHKLDQERINAGLPLRRLGFVSKYV